MTFSVAVSVHAKDQIFLPRAFTGLMNQTFRDFEVIVVVGGEEPLTRYEPAATSQRVIETRVFHFPHSDPKGNRNRYRVMSLARGEYLVWLNVDNLVYPSWLENHASNIRCAPGAISLVNIQYWHLHEYWGVLPCALSCGSVDLLNYAVPRELAQSVSAFGPDEEHIAYVDWLVFERCARHATVVWDKTQPVCACHF
jgi:hypothetical protein